MYFVNFKTVLEGGGRGGVVYDEGGVVGYFIQPPSARFNSDCNCSLIQLSLNILLNRLEYLCWQKEYLSNNFVLVDVNIPAFTEVLGQYLLMQITQASKI